MTIKTFPAPTVNSDVALNVTVGLNVADVCEHINDRPGYAVGLYDVDAPCPTDSQYSNVYLSCSFISRNSNGCCLNTRYSISVSCECVAAVG